MSLSDRVRALDATASAAALDDVLRIGRALGCVVVFVSGRQFFSALVGDGSEKKRDRPLDFALLQLSELKACLAGRVARGSPDALAGRGAIFSHVPASVPSARAGARLGAAAGARWARQ